MKQAILLHGTGGNDQSYFWFADAKKFLEARSYRVWWPQLPNTDRPRLEESLQFVQTNMPKVDSESIIIGHSSACPLILSLLQRSDFKIKQAILVAGYYSAIGDVVSDLMIEKNDYDLEKIKNSANEIIFINSDNDPWGCTAEHARPTADKLAARLVVAKDQGHMGSNSFNQPYREHKLVKELIKA